MSSWTEEPGRLQSMGSQRVGHNWVTSLYSTSFRGGVADKLACVQRLHTSHSVSVNLEEKWKKWKSLSYVDSLWPHGLYSPWNSGQNTGVGTLSLLQLTFPTQVSWLWADSLHQLSYKGSPRILEWIAYPLSRGSSQPRNQTGVSCIAGKFFFSWTIREALILMSLFDSWPLLACWLFLPCLATVHICPLELRKGLRGWILFPSKKKTGDRKARSTTGSWSFSVLINAV